MSADQNKEIIRKIFQEGMNERNISVAEKYISPEYINYGIPGHQPGFEGFNAIIKQFTDAFPDMVITQDEIIGEGDTVATRGSWTGTNNGSFMGMPPTGKKVTVQFMDFWKLKDGKCIENWVQMDIAGLMQQLGATPS